MVTSLLAATLALSAKIDFETTGATVPAIVERLAEQTGLPLIADKSLECDVLVLSLKQVEVDQALDWIASVIDGEWREDRGKRRLLRTPATEIAQARSEKSEAMREMRSALDEIKVAPPIDKETAERMVPLIKQILGNEFAYGQLPYEFASRTPMQRLVSRLAKDLDLTKFVDLPDNVRIFVPFDEHSVDARLPRSLIGYLRDFKREDAVYSKAITQSGLDLSQINGHAFKPGAWNEGPLRGAVCMTGFDGIFNLSVVLFWGPIASRQESIRYPDSAWPSKWESIKRPEWDVEWAVPQLTREFASLPSQSYAITTDAPRALPASVIEYFTVADDFDPFGLGAGRLLIDAARLSGKNLVACLPDSSALLIRAVSRFPHPTVQQVVDRVAMRYLAAPTLTDDLLMFKPVRPTECRRDRLPRATIRKIVVDGLAGTSDFAVFAEAIAKCEPPTYVGDPRDSYASVTQINLFKSHHDLATFALHLYGKLNSAQRETAEQQQFFIPWQSLTNQDRVVWNYVVQSVGMVGYPGTWAVVEDGEGSKELVERINALGSISRSGRGPAGLAIEVERSSTLVGGSTTDEHIPLQMIEESSLASMIAHKELGLPGWELDRFFVLPFTEIKVSVRVAGRDYLLATYGESYAKKGQDMFGYQSIPKEMIDSRRAQIDAYKKLLRDRGG